MAIKAFRQKPHGFNGPLGSSFFEWIDDSDRNVLLCASSASNEAVTSMIDGDRSRSESLMRLSQNGTDLSTLLYTVSENASALYTRYVKAAEKVAAEGADVATKCAEARELGTSHQLLGDYLRRLDKWQRKEYIRRAEEIRRMDFLAAPFAPPRSSP